MLMFTLAHAATDSSVVHRPFDDSLLSVRQMQRDGRFAAAESASRILLRQAETQFGPEAPETGAAINALVSALNRLSRLGEPESRQLAERSMRIAQPPRERIRTIDNLAAVHYSARNYLGARPLYYQVLRLREEVLGPDHPEVGNTLFNIGFCSKFIGDYPEARAALERLITIREKSLGPDHIVVATSYANLGAVLTEAGDYAAARSALELALRKLEKLKGADDMGITPCLGMLGNLCVDTGNYAEARQFYERELSIEERSKGSDSPFVAGTLTGLANVHGYLGENDAALPLYERALSIAERAWGPDSPDLALYVMNLGEIHHRMGHAIRARHFYERSLRIREAQGASPTPSLSSSLKGLATVLMDVGDCAEALPLLLKARAIDIGALGAGHPEVSRDDGQLALIRLYLGERDSALANALSCEATSRAHLKLTSASLSESQALSYADSRAEGIPTALSAVSRDTAGAVVDRIWDQLVRTRAVLLDEMTKRHRFVAASTDPVLDSLRAVISSRGARLAHLTLAGPDRMSSEEYQSLVQVTAREKENAERQLAARSARDREEQRRDEAGLDDVLRHLPAAAGLVAFVRYRHVSAPLPAGGAYGLIPDTTDTVPVRDSSIVRAAWRYMAFVAPPKSGVGGRTERRLIALGDADKIDSLIAQWRRCAEDSRKCDESHYREAGVELRERIWDPIAHELKGWAMVFMVPDAEINLVSFATLPTGAQHYLIEDGPLFHYLSAERDLLLEERFRGETPPVAQGLLALGNPDFDHAAVNPSLAASDASAYRGELSRCVRFRSMRFRRLPATEQEVEGIRASWEAQHGAPDRSRVTLRTGAEASEEVFKAAAPGRRTIHLATHGFFLGSECPESLQPASVDASSGEGAPRSAPDRENPLLRSGLVLSGANGSGGQDTHEDGLLTAEEIGSLDLRAAEWVVLSACGTGLGETRSGEGIFGLRRAFSVAGARTLVMSLWAVQDEATADWMRRLYRARYERRLATPQALREASLGRLTALRRAGLPTHPGGWGAFIAAGDWK